MSDYHLDYENATPDEKEYIDSKDDRGIFPEIKFFNEFEKYNLCEKHNSVNIVKTYFDNNNKIYCMPCIFDYIESIGIKPLISKEKL